jgi:hypothetical protein
VKSGGPGERKVLTVDKLTDLHIEISADIVQAMHHHRMGEVYKARHHYHRAYKFAKLVRSPRVQARMWVMLTAVGKMVYAQT